MSYGPGDNRIIIAADGDSIESGVSKIKAQFDALYDGLASDLLPSTSSNAGLVRIATQAEADNGSAASAVLTPLTLISSALADKAAKNALAVSEISAEYTALAAFIQQAAANANNALAVAMAAFPAASGGDNGDNNVMESPTASTFKAMPAAERYPYTPVGGASSFYRYEIRLPAGGKWAFCGSIAYDWQRGGQNDQSGSEEIPLCGIADGGSNIWYATAANKGLYITSVHTYGFVWRIAEADGAVDGGYESGGAFGDGTSVVASGGGF